MRTDSAANQIRIALLKRLYAAVPKATNGELHRAIDFLEWAHGIKRGKTRTRTRARADWVEKRVERPVWWTE